MGYGTIGNELATLIDLASQKKDVMRVQMPDAQASALIYGDGGELGQSELPVVGQPVCASLGISAAKKCGTVTDDWTSWTSNYCDCTVYGGDTSLSTIPGDSGSPLYEKWSYGGEYYITPIGVMDRATGEFARMADAQAAWGFTVVTL